MHSRVEGPGDAFKSIVGPPQNARYLAGLNESQSRLEDTTPTSAFHLEPTSAADFFSSNSGHLGSGVLASPEAFSVRSVSQASMERDGLTRWWVSLRKRAQERFEELGEFVGEG